MCAFLCISDCQEDAEFAVLGWPVNMSTDQNYIGAPSAEAAQMLSDFWPNAIQQIRNLTNVGFMAVLWQFEASLRKSFVCDFCTISFSELVS